MHRHGFDADDLLAVVSEEETLEMQRKAAVQDGADAAEIRRIDTLLVAAMRREAEAEGEADSERDPRS